MSEHRKTSAFKSERSHLEKILNAKTCDLWPDCICKQALVRWQSNLTEDRTWDIKDLSWGETSAFFALSCVAHRCPSRKYRAYAQVQLLNPWWDRQRLGITMAEMFGKGERDDHTRR